MAPSGHDPVALPAAERHAPGLIMDKACSLGGGNDLLWYLLLLR